MIDDIQRLFAQHNVRQVKVGGFDIDGVFRGKYISLEKFFSVVENGFGFCDVIFGWDSSDVLYDNVTYTGWHTGYPDALAKVDLDTCRVVPWAQSAYTAPEGMFPPLPRSLAEATARLKESRIARELLGDAFVEHFVATREWEVRRFQYAVTDWELQRYFEVI